MDEKALKQITLVRYYLSLAHSQISIGDEASKFAGINILHEAFEATLICCADHLNAQIAERSVIEQYLDKIQEKHGQVIPFRTRLLQFNRARISAKHALTLPDDTSLSKFFEVIPEACRELISQIFGVELEQVSLVDLVSDEQVREHLNVALLQLKNGLNYDGLASVRKAFFEKFEKDFDVSIFKDTKPGEKYGFLDSRWSCKAPQYAKSSAYIGNYILELASVVCQTSRDRPVLILH